MSEEVERIDIAEFREFGYLQELNRRFLHPLGLALEVEIADDGTERLGGVWDYRDDAEGIRYDGDYAGLLTEKATRVNAEWTAREHARIAALGYMVQPISGNE